MHRMTWFGGVTEVQSDPYRPEEKSYIFVNKQNDQYQFFQFKN